MATLLSQTDENSGNLLYITNNPDGHTPLAQVFVVPSGHIWILSRIAFKSDPDSAYNTEVTGYLCGVDEAGLPDATNILETTPNAADSGIINFYFTSTLTAGTYACVADVTYSASIEDQVLVNSFYGTPDKYAGGKAYVGLTTGALTDTEWSEAGGGDYQDFVFWVLGTEGVVFTPPAGGPTHRRLIACANNKFWYEDI